MSDATVHGGERSVRRNALLAAIVTVLVVGGSIVATQLGGPKSNPANGASLGETTSPPSVVVSTSTSTTLTATTSTSTSTSSTTAAPTPTTTLPPLPCPNAKGSTERVTAFPSPPPVCIDPEATYRAEIETSVGTFTVLLDAVGAPLATNNFVYLARYHFYDGLAFHRIVSGFVIQTGDPLGAGSGGPGYTFPDELPRTPGYPIGAVAMSNGNPSRPDSNGSQFFIVIGRAGEDLEPLYPLFGKVTEGLAIAKLIGSGGVDQSGAMSTPVAPATIVRITIAAENERPDLGRLP